MDSKLASYFATLKEGKGGGGARAARDELVNFKMRVAGLVEAFCKRVSAAGGWRKRAGRWLAGLAGLQPLGVGSGAASWCVHRRGQRGSAGNLQRVAVSCCWGQVAETSLSPRPTSCPGAGQPAAAGRGGATAGGAGGREPAGRPPGAG